MPVRKLVTVGVVYEELSRHVTDCMEERKITTKALEDLKKEVENATSIANITRNTVQSYEYVFNQINKSLRWVVRAVLLAALTAVASISAQEFMRHSENTIVRRETAIDQNRLASEIANAVKDKNK